MDINKKMYVSPRLTPQEHLRDITLGGTPGSRESGNPTLFNPLPGERATTGGDASGDTFSAYNWDDNPFKDS
jgi:hypothetical protein